MPRAPSLALRWWAQQWIEPVESLGPEFGGRLSRARSYARNRRIWQLGVRPGMLSAQALGSFGYYAVTVQVPSNPDGVWERVQTTLSARPALLASLLADDLPADVEQAFNDAGGSLFYGDAELLGFHCTCLDWQRPCKHTLAVCYDFATQASAHPGLLLALAGRTVEQVVAALHARWAATDPQRADSLPPVDDRDDRPLRAVGFYSAGPSFDQLSIPFETPRVNAALLLKLGKPPFATEAEDPLTPLAAFYAAMTEQASRVLSRSRHTIDSSETADTARSGVAAAEDSTDNEV